MANFVGDVFIDQQGNLHVARSIYLWEALEQDGTVVTHEVMETSKGLRFFTTSMTLNLSAAQRLVDDYDTLPEEVHRKEREVKRRKFDLGNL